LARTSRHGVNRIVGRLEQSLREAEVLQLQPLAGRRAERGF
jgi:hypothetical protein